MNQPKTSTQTPRSQSTTQDPRPQRLLSLTSASPRSLQQAPTQAPESRWLSCSYGVHSNVFDYMDTIDLIRTNMALGKSSRDLRDSVCTGETLNNRLKKFLHNPYIRVDLYKLIINGAMIKTLPDYNVKTWWHREIETYAPSIVAQFMNGWKTMVIRTVDVYKKATFVIRPIYLDVLEDSIDKIVRILSEAGFKPMLRNGKEVKKLMACKTVVFDVGSQIINVSQYSIYTDEFSIQSWTL